MDAELKACSLLERLTERLDDATVDYQCNRGVHEFLVRRAGSRFKIEFSEPSLLRRSEQELEQAAGRIVERIRAFSQPASAPATRAAA